MPQRLQEMTIEDLRNHGCAVTVFTPADVQDTSDMTYEACQTWLANNRRYVEDAMTETGWNAIQQLLPCKEE